MNTDTLRGKVKRHMEEEQISLRTMAREARMPVSTLSEYLSEKRDISVHVMRRLVRCVDPARGDLAVRAAEFFRTLKRQAYHGDEISLIGENLCKMGKVLASSIPNTPEHSRTP